MRRQLLVALAIVLVVGGGAFAQGTQTATLSGTVQSADNRTMPGVTVNLTSPALLGIRTAVTDANGGYIFKGLPPGTYKVSYELSGFATLEKTVTLALGSATPLDATLHGGHRFGAGDGHRRGALAPHHHAGGGQHHEGDGRQPGDRSEHPGGGPARARPHRQDTERRARSRSRAAFAYDNVFLVDGTDINDNLFGNPNNRLHRGRSRGDPGPDLRDHGRVRPVQRRRDQRGDEAREATSSRGASARASATPRGETRPRTRRRTTSRARASSASSTRQPSADRSSRTGSGSSRPAARSRATPSPPPRRAGSPSPRPVTRSGARSSCPAPSPRTTPSRPPTRRFATTSSDSPFGSTVDLDPAHTGLPVGQPADLFSANYNGVLKSNLSIEAQYSRKTFSFTELRGHEQEPHRLALPRSDPGFFAYNAPYFDATDPEDRNNRQITAALSYFASTSGFGKHDIKVGYEHYTSTRTGGNSQSSTDYVFYTDYLDRRRRQTGVRQQRLRDPGVHSRREPDPELAGGAGSRESTSPPRPPS